MVEEKGSQEGWGQIREELFLEVAAQTRETTRWVGR